MQAPWHEGDVASATCSVCGNQVNARYETRDIRLSRSAVTFSDILVGVCNSCEAITLPRQSVAQILELSSWK